MPRSPASSRARHRRSTTTTSTATPAARIASRMVPLPDASTPTRTGPTVPRRRAAEGPSHHGPRLFNFARAGNREAHVDKKLSQAEWVIVAGGFVAFIASFLPWVDFHGFTANAWDDFAFPTYTWVGIFGLVM